METSFVWQSQNQLVSINELTNCHHYVEVWKSPSCMFLDPINVILELNDPNERMYSLKEERRVSVHF